MKKLHTGGFLKSPFNMYEGTSIDSGSHKQATEQKGEESGDAGCVEKKGLFSCQQTLPCVHRVLRKGTTQSLCLPCPAIPSTTKQSESVCVLSVCNLLNKLQQYTKAL